MTGAELAFAGFGLTTQALLLGYFAARRWWPRHAAHHGWVVYAYAGIGLPLGVWLLLDGQAWTLFVGPLLMALWALFGALVDLWRPRQWRCGQGERSVLVAFVALYLSAQMFMWWPLWNIEPAAWVLFLMLFVPSTTLNIRGHFGGSATQDAAKGPR